MLAVIFHWDTFFHYVWPPTALQNPLIRSGLWVTIYMAVLAQLIGVILGAVCALMLLSKHRALRWIAVVYVTYFRGTPVLVQLSLIYFGSAAIGIYQFPDLTVGGLMLPGIVQAGILGLGINEGAYMAEIIRAGIISTEAGQMEAAKALGMPFRTAMIWIIAPQAAKVIIPPLGNEFNNMLKSTTLVTVIGGIELFNAFEQVNSVLFEPFELFLAVSFYYLALTIAWGFVQSRIEAGLGERKGIERRPSTLRRLLGGTRVSRVSSR
ncbi:MAG TPA: amino acid ABC transporter permease [Chloroflexota bacterium]|nr:amino acid ABC transporter permease [Chloroflexota bacterium]